VALGVEEQVTFGDARRFDVGVEDTNFIEHGTSDVFRVWADDGAAAAQEKVG
jgi:hypothetical protein